VIAGRGGSQISSSLFTICVASGRGAASGGTTCCVAEGHRRCDPPSHRAERNRPSLERGGPDPPMNLRSDTHRERGWYWRDGDRQDLGLTSGKKSAIGWCGCVDRSCTDHDRRVCKSWWHTLDCRRFRSVSTRSALRIAELGLGVLDHLWVLSHHADFQAGNAAQGNAPHARR
jgi:hypothetical protein